ncbi:hypothetical protein ADUPG1_009964 [Aduncisulcus paluster]|uniref:Uncharacterized protein n=1 Tax=Aduncisulcus paluster TaxID=2918883 RepID=A0ABQ5KYI6_9EUKA|nr:hypothetical protein ADUPG1_009964 [Aduncisulcus paluster]
MESDEQLIDYPSLLGIPTSSLCFCSDCLVLGLASAGFAIVDSTSLDIICEQKKTPHTSPITCMTQDGMGRLWTVDKEGTCVCWGFKDLEPITDTETEAGESYSDEERPSPTETGKSPVIPFVIKIFSIHSSSSASIVAPRHVGRRSTNSKRSKEKKLEITSICGSTQHKSVLIGCSDGSIRRCTCSATSLKAISRPNLLTVLPVSSKKGGQSHCSSDTKPSKSAKRSSSTAITSIMMLENGHIYACGEQGVFMWQGSISRGKGVSDTKPSKSAKRSSSTAITSIMMLENGHIYACGEQGVFMWQGSISRGKGVCICDKPTSMLALCELELNIDGYDDANPMYRGDEDDVPPGDLGEISGDGHSMFQSSVLSAVSPTSTTGMYSISRDTTHSESFSDTDRSQASGSIPIDSVPSNLSLCVCMGHKDGSVSVFEVESGCIVWSCDGVKREAELDIPSISHVHGDDMHDDTADSHDLSAISGITADSSIVQCKVDVQQADHSSRSHVVTHSSHTIPAKRGVRCLLSVGHFLFVGRVDGSLECYDLYEDFSPPSSIVSCTVDEESNSYCTHIVAWGDCLYGSVIGRVSKAQLELEASLAAERDERAMQRQPSLYGATGKDSTTTSVHKPSHVTVKAGQVVRDFMRWSIPSLLGDHMKEIMEGEEVEEVEEVEEGEGEEGEKHGDVNAIVIRSGMAVEPTPSPIMTSSRGIVLNEEYDSQSKNAITLVDYDNVPESPSLSLLSLLDLLSRGLLSESDTLAAMLEMGVQMGKKEADIHDMVKRCIEEKGKSVLSDRQDSTLDNTIPNTSNETFTDAESQSIGSHERTDKAEGKEEREGKEGREEVDDDDEEEEEEEEDIFEIEDISELSPHPLSLSHLSQVVSNTPLVTSSSNIIPGTTGVAIPASHHRSSMGLRVREHNSGVSLSPTTTVGRRYSPFVSSGGCGDHSQSMSGHSGFDSRIVGTLGTPAVVQSSRLRKDTTPSTVKKNQLTKDQEDDGEKEEEEEEEKGKEKEIGKIETKQTKGRNNNATVKKNQLTKDQEDDGEKEEEEEEEKGKEKEIGKIETKQTKGRNNNACIRTSSSTQTGLHGILTKAKKYDISTKSVAQRTMIVTNAGTSMSPPVPGTESDLTENQTHHHPFPSFSPTLSHGLTTVFHAHLIKESASMRERLQELQWKLVVEKEASREGEERRKELCGIVEECERVNEELEDQIVTLRDRVQEFEEKEERFFEEKRVYENNTQEIVDLRDAQIAELEAVVSELTIQLEQYQVSGSIQSQVMLNSSLQEEEERGREEEEAQEEGEAQEGEEAEMMIDVESHILELEAVVNDLSVDLQESEANYEDLMVKYKEQESKLEHTELDLENLSDDYSDLKGQLQSALSELDLCKSQLKEKEKRAKESKRREEQHYVGMSVPFPSLSLSELPLSAFTHLILPFEKTHAASKDLTSIQDVGMEEDGGGEEREEAQEPMTPPLPSLDSLHSPCSTYSPSTTMTSKTTLGTMCGATSLLSSHLPFSVSEEAIDLKDANNRVKMLLNCISELECDIGVLVSWVSNNRSSIFRTDSSITTDIDACSGSDSGSDVDDSLSVYRKDTIRKGMQDKVNRRMKLFQILQGSENGGSDSGDSIVKASMEGKEEHKEEQGTSLSLRDNQTLQMLSSIKLLKQSILDLRTDNSSKDSRIEVLKQDLYSKEEEFDTILCKFDESSKKGVELEKKIDQINIILKGKEEEAQTLNNRLVECQGLLQISETTRIEIESRCSELQTTLDTLREQYSVSESHLTQCKSDKKISESRIVSLMTDLDKTQEIVQKLRRFESMYIAEKENKSKLEDKLRELEADYASISTELKSTQSELLKSREDMKHAQSEHSAVLSSSLSSLSSSLSLQHQEAITKVRNELQEKVSNLREEITISSMKLKTCKDDCAQLREEIESLDGKCHSIQSELKEKDKRIKELTNDLETQKYQFKSEEKKLKEENEQSEKRFVEKLKEFEEKCRVEESKHCREMSSWKDQEREFIEESKKLNSIIESKTHGITLAEDRIKLLVSQHKKDKNRLIENHSEELETVQAEVSILKTRLSNLISKSEKESFSLQSNLDSVTEKLSYERSEKQKEISLKEQEIRQKKRAKKLAEDERRDKEKLKEQFERTKRQLDEEKRAKETFNIELTNLQKKYESQHSVTEKLSYERSEKQKEISLKEQENRQKKRAKKLAEDERRDKEKLKEQFERTKRQLDEEKRAKETFNIELTNLQKKYESQRLELISLKDCHSSLSSEYSILEKEHSELKSQHCQSCCDLKTLQSIKQGMESDHAHSVIVLTQEYEAKLSNLSKKLEISEDSLSSLHSHSQDTMERLSESEHTIKLKDEEISSLKAVMDEMEAKVSEMRRDYANLEELSRKAQEAKKKVDSMLGVASITSSKHRQALYSIGKENAKLIRRNRALELALRQSIIRNPSSSSSSSAMDGDNDMTIDCSQTSNETCAKISQLYLKLRRRLSLCESELIRTKTDLKEQFMKKRTEDTSHVINPTILSFIQLLESTIVKMSSEALKQRLKRYKKEEDLDSNLRVSISRLTYLCGELEKDIVCPKEKIGETLQNDLNNSIEIGKRMRIIRLILNSFVSVVDNTSGSRLVSQEKEEKKKEDDVTPSPSEIQETRMVTDEPESAMKGEEREELLQKQEQAAWKLLVGVLYSSCLLLSHEAEIE